MNLSISPVRGRAPLARQQLPDALSVDDLLQTTSNIFSNGSWTEQQELNHAAFILGAEKTASGWMPVAAIGKTAVLIATAEKQDTRMPRSIDLINLGLTAARTGFELTKGSAVVITPSPQVWIDLLPPDRVFIPAHYKKIMDSIRDKKSPEQKFVIVIDDLRPEQGITTDAIMALAQVRNTWVLLIVEQPKYAADLAHTIQSSRLITGVMSEASKAAFPQVDVPTANIFSPAPGQFVMRHKRGWTIFSPANQHP